MRSIAIAVLVAAALASATMLVASLSSGAFIHWIQSLPAGRAKLVQPALALSTVLFVCIGVFLRRRGALEDEH